MFRWVDWGELYPRYSPLDYLIYYYYCIVNVNVFCLPTKHLGAWKLFKTCSCAPDLIGIWKCWFLRRGENRITRRKTSQSKDENQQQTQPTYDTGTGSRTRATLVGGERSHHCPIPAPPIHSLVRSVVRSFVRSFIHSLLRRGLLQSRLDCTLGKKRAARAPIFYLQRSRFPLFSFTGVY